MGEHITKSQSQRCCHCYGSVRAPAPWCLGGRHREDFGGAVSGAAPRPALLVAGLASSLLLPACGSHRRARVRVGAVAALEPGPYRSLPHRRRLRGAARCSRRVRPRRIPPPTGTSPLSPRLMQKVRLALGGRRARRGGVFLVLRWLWPGGDSPLAAPALCACGASDRARAAQGGVGGSFASSFSVGSGFPYCVWGRFFWATCPP